MHVIRTRVPEYGYVVATRKEGGTEVIESNSGLIVALWCHHSDHNEDANTDVVRRIVGDENYRASLKEEWRKS